MKLSLVLSMLILCLPGYSQRSVNDSAANCVANWRVGETKTYSIVHEKVITGGSVNTPPISYSYLAHVSVIDATPDSYTIKWIFQLPGEFKKMHPRLADSLPVFDGMQMIFTVSEMGTFTELLNWEEVRDTYIRQMEMSLPKNMDKETKATLDDTKKMFGSRQMVESAMIREIQLFHLPYGYQFTTTEGRSDTRFPNPYGGPALPARQTYKLTSLDKARDAFTLVFHITTDKGGSGHYDLQDYTEYNFIHSTGWIRRLWYKSAASDGKSGQSESYSIELQD